EGSRNNGLFNIGVYLRKRYGDDFWEDKLDEYNSKFLDPPLGHKEVASVIRSLRRKTYEFKCNDAPINACCSRQICLTRKYGIGTSEGDSGVVFGNLVKITTSPPIWIWDVDGERIELTTAELKDQNRFQTRAVEELNKWPATIKPKAWKELVAEKLANVEIQEAPPDARPEGQMLALLEEFCTQRAQARDREEMSMGKPWTPRNPEEEADKPLIGSTFFSAVKFKAFLETNRVRIDERQLWSWLRKHGAVPHFFNIKGKGTNVWRIPAFPEQNEDYSIPTLEDL
ncbi:MAG: primase C-terminal domain-containing protein, partial [Bacilli bacterium]